METVSESIAAFFFFFFVCTDPPIVPPVGVGDGSTVPQYQSSTAPNGSVAPDSVGLSLAIARGVAIFIFGFLLFLLLRYRTCERSEVSPSSP